MDSLQNHTLKWYKFGNLGSCSFDILNSHIDWNMSFELTVLCGVQMREPLNKFQFSAILDKELMSFADFVDTHNMTDLHSSMR